jgi:hypothetical protein
MKDNVSELLQQEMSRKEFLTTVGYGVASLVGIAGVMRMLGHRGFKAASSSHGYGASAYGK